ncbi:MAG TPA: ATPase, partial [Sphingomonas sp.]|nr:ATPase [Sphingomonas sp.]
QAASEATLATAGEAAAAQVSAAEARIASASQAAMAEIETVAADAAQDIVSRLSGAAVTTAEAQAATKAVLHG